MRAPMGGSDLLCQRHTWLHVTVPPATRPVPGEGISGLKEPMHGAGSGPRTQ